MYVRFGTSSALPGWTRRIEKLLAEARPGRDVELLLKVIAASDLEAAAVWFEWRKEYSIADAPPRQWRLLGAVGRKLLGSDIDASDRSALAGVKRTIWRDNQLRIAGHAAILKRLHEAGIPMMVLKGGARIASEAGAMETRFARDIDLLFPSRRLVDALDVLMGMGLRSVNGRLPGMVKSQALAPLYPPGRRPRGYLEIDVHSVPLRLGHRADNEQALWERSLPGTLGGVAVRVPSASDRYVQAIAHGLVADDESPADWVVDASVALRDPGFEPEVVVAEVYRRRLGVPVAIGSLFMRDRLGVPVPESIIEACARDASLLTYRLEMKGILKLSRQRSLMDRVLAEVAERRRVAGRDPAMRSWNTSWIFRPSLRSPPHRWTTFRDGVASMDLQPPAYSANGRLRLFLSCPKASLADRSFDVLLGGVWIGRVRLRATHLLKLMPSRSWRSEIVYRLPSHRSPPNPCRLEIVLLDERKMPMAACVPSLKIAAEVLTVEQAACATPYAECP